MRVWAKTAMLAVLATGSAMPAVAQEGSEGSRAFVEQVFAAYSGYGEGVAWPLDDRRLDEVWTPQMAALLRRNRELGEGRPGYRELDPLCQCAAWGDLRIERMAGGLRNDGRRVIQVSFTNDGEHRDTFVRLEGDPIRGWRIADVLRADGASLGDALGGTGETDGAEAFVRSVYASYSRDPEARPPMAGDSPLVWSDRMMSLIARNEDLAKGEMPYIEADPICNCQDWDNLLVTETSVGRAPDGAVLVTTRFMNGGQEQVSLLKLEGNSSRGWRITDVLTPGYPGLYESLEASNARMEAGGAAHD